MPLDRGMVAYIQDEYGAFCQPKFECGCFEILFLWFMVRDRTYVFSLYHNPDLDDWIFDCLLTSMAAVQAEEMVGLGVEWLGPTTTNRHGVAAIDFSTVSACDQLVVSHTHACGGTLDLLMTDVPDLVWVAVVAPIGNSDHSSLSAVILMAQAVPN